MPTRPPSKKGRDLTALEEAQEDLRVFQGMLRYYSDVESGRNVEKLDTLHDEIAALEAEADRLMDEVARAPSEVERYTRKVEEQTRVVDLVRRDPRVVGFTRGARRRPIYAGSKLEKALKIRRQLRELEAQIAADETPDDDTVFCEGGCHAESRDDGWHWRPTGGGGFTGPFETLYDALRDAGFTPEDARHHSDAL